MNSDSLIELIKIKMEVLEIMSDDKNRLYFSSYESCLSHSQHVEVRLQWILSDHGYPIGVQINVCL